MNATIQLNLKSFLVPAYVGVVQAPRPRQEGIGKARVVSLGELDTETLNRLVDEFRASIHEKAAAQRLAGTVGGSE